MSKSLESYMDKNIHKQLSGLKFLMFGEIVNINNTFRFSGKRVNRNQTVSEHSYWVTLISLQLARIENSLRINLVNSPDYLDTKKGVCDFPQVDLITVVDYALLHDVDEAFTGDINHEFKYFKENTNEGEKFRETLREMTRQIVLSKLEAKASPEFLKVYEKLMDEKLFKEEMWFVKIADYLQLMQYVTEEIYSGSKHLHSVVYRVSSLFEKKLNEYEHYNKKKNTWDYEKPTYFNKFLIAELLREILDEFKKNCLNFLT